MGKFIDSSLLDKAIIFATNAHKNTERNGKGFPYIVHPLEVCEIVATMTNDQEMLAAAMLHDTVEDTDVTIEDINREFGPRVALLVANESESQVLGKSKSESWVERKTAAIARIKASSYESKIVALGDKLSNMRAIYRDYFAKGDEFWSIFHVSDPKLHEWHYRGLADALKDLEGTAAYEEFVKRIDLVFLYNKRPFAIKKAPGEDNNIIISGYVDNETSIQIENALEKGKEYIFDFKDVNGINFSGCRALVRMLDHGYKFIIRNVHKRIMDVLDTSGISKFISVIMQPDDFVLSHANLFSEGFTSKSYFSDDQDSMIKLYDECEGVETVEKEKWIAEQALYLGIPTPLTGNIVKSGNQYGLIFERVPGKISIGRLLSFEPSKYDEIAKDFAQSVKKLHTLECNSHVIKGIKEKYLEVVKNYKSLPENQKQILLEFINNVPDKKTCLHGDLTIGNVIKNDLGEYLFIDIGNLAYGDPRFDLGNLYYTCHNNNEVASMSMYHCSCELMLKFWKSFVKYYFNVNSKEEIAKIDADILPFAVVYLVCLSNTMNNPEWMVRLINSWFKK